MSEQDVLGALATLVLERAQERRDGAFLVGMAGGVAVGKSTLARALAERLAPGPVQVVATDGFLRPNAELAAGDLIRRKGFPETYDVGAFARFLAELAAGRPATMPVYSHATYDIVPGETRTVDAAGVVIVEGINVLQSAEARARFGMKVYVDADPAHMHAWYLRRLEEIVANEPGSLIAQVKDPAQRLAIVEAAWRDINLVNLTEHIAPTAAHADVVVRKAADHGLLELVVC
jgi:type I pantothenate kinase